jgi:hypothetical protein
MTLHTLLVRPVVILIAQYGLIGLFTRHCYRMVQICTVKYLLMKDDSMKSLSEDHKPVEQPTAARLSPLCAPNAHLCIQ